MQGGRAARASEQGGQVEEEGRLDGVRHASGRKMQHPGQQVPPHRAAQVRGEGDQKRRRSDEASGGTV